MDERLPPTSKNKQTNTERRYIRNKNIWEDFNNMEESLLCCDLSELLCAMYSHLGSGSFRGQFDAVLMVPFGLLHFSGHSDDTWTTPPKQVWRHFMFFFSCFTSPQLPRAIYWVEFFPSMKLERWTVRWNRRCHRRLNGAVVCTENLNMAEFKLLH